MKDRAMVPAPTSPESPLAAPLSATLEEREEGKGRE